MSTVAEIEHYATMRRERDAAVARVAELEAALATIAERNPVNEFGSAGALSMRLVGIQSIARAALKGKA